MQSDLVVDGLAAGRGDAVSHLHWYGSSPIIFGRPDQTTSLDVTSRS